MISNSSSGKDIKPPSLTVAEIDKILSMTLIGNLATLGEDYTSILSKCGLFVLETISAFQLLITHANTKNLRATPFASVMIDISHAGLDLKGVMIKGPVELVEGEEARMINHQIHLKYVTEDGLNDPSVASYLSKGDDVTVKIHMDQLVNWNLADSKARRALRANDWSRLLDA